MPLVCGLLEKKRWQGAVGRGQEPFSQSACPAVLGLMKSERFEKWPLPMDLGENHQGPNGAGFERIAGCFWRCRISMAANTSRWTIDR